jgi:hypothetical protein
MKEKEEEEKEEAIVEEEKEEDDPFKILVVVITFIHHSPPKIIKSINTASTSEIVRTTTPSIAESSPVLFQLQVSTMEVSSTSSTEL